MVTDLTYNAITTDFWANLDALTGPDKWEMRGTAQPRDSRRRPTASRTAHLTCASRR